ncbi:hypothetical protein EJ04DRAFT_552741 [Polyplosphaeria fusca]|uniref:Uncharacterized protein n=1 Tax=Polyplosphaeria fusca TaxID=682080 RepID=A0A9P4QX59_9PLEO|nr:hypothetical protein EJ04DRAFT_552741 [Polyplosphaeria fusca]
MAFHLLSTAPTDEDYTPLAQHQEQTPLTFFGGRPILYERASGLTLVVPKDKLDSDAAIAKFSFVEEGDNALVKDVDMWVNSENLAFFQSGPNSTGVAIPFPSIALHATMKWKDQIEALYMNLSLNDAEQVNDEDDILMLDIIVLPPKYDTVPEPECIKAIYTAMNTCADLHPDPNGSDVAEEEDMSAPGATGWITAENMDQYADEDGNFYIGGGEAGGEELGPGAGTVRPREDGDETNGVNGVDHEQKHQRTN